MVMHLTFFFSAIDFRPSRAAGWRKIVLCNYAASVYTLVSMLYFPFTSDQKCVVPLVPD